MPKKRVQCDICQKWLDHQAIAGHLERHASDPQQCPHCGKQSINPQALKQHIKRVHDTRTKFPCNFCGDVLKSAEELKVSVNWIWADQLLTDQILDLCF